MFPREDIFVGTKLWCNDYHPEDVERAVHDSLRDLDTPYVDLLLMHYPCTFMRGAERFPRDAAGRMVRGETTYVDTWRAMENLTQTGKVKAIGVSNFSKGEIETLLKESSTVGSSHKLTQGCDVNRFFRSRLFTRWRSTRTCSRRASTSG